MILTSILLAVTPIEAATFRPALQVETSYFVKKKKKRKAAAARRSFSSCKAARAAGYSHMRRGQPGYSANLDRDGDGVACDKKR